MKAKDKNDYIKKLLRKISALHKYNEDGGEYNQALYDVKKLLKDEKRYKRH